MWKIFNGYSYCNCLACFIHFLFLKKIIASFKTRAIMQMLEKGVFQFAGPGEISCSMKTYRINGGWEKGYP